MENEAISEKYHIVHTDPEKYVDNYFIHGEEVHIADVLMSTAQEVLKGQEQLTLKFIESLKNIYKNLIGSKTIVTEGASDMDTFFSTALEVFSKYKTTQIYRKRFREVFNQRIFDMIKKFDDIITEYEATVLKGKKQLLLIIDGWEKIRDLNSLRRIFNHGLGDFQRLRARKNNHHTRFYGPT